MAARQPEVPPSLDELRRRHGTAPPPVASATPEPSQPALVPSDLLGALKASELHLSSEELIEVMNRVKAGNISVDDAVAEVLAVNRGRSNSQPELPASPPPPAQTATPATESHTTTKTTKTTNANTNTNINNSASNTATTAGQGNPTLAPAVPPKPAAKPKTTAPDASTRSHPMGPPPVNAPVKHLTNDEQLRVFRQVKCGDMTVDDALAYVQTLSHTPPQTTASSPPPPADHEASLLHALAKAGAHVDALHETRRPEPPARASPTPQHPTAHDTDQHDHDLEPAGPHDNSGPEISPSSDSVPNATPEPDCEAPTAALSQVEVQEVLHIYGLSAHLDNDAAADSDLSLNSQRPDADAPALSALTPNPTVAPRVSLLLNRHRHRTALVPLPHTLPELLAIASRQLQCHAKRIYLLNGTHVQDLACLRDEDTLVVTEGESFRKAGRWTSLTSLDSLASNTVAMPDGPRTSSAGRQQWIKLNVGGRIFQTTLETLTRWEDSMLATMFLSDHWESTMDDNGCHLLDRNPRYFEPLLGFMRDGVLTLDPGLSRRGVLAEAHFFGLWAAIDILEPLAREEAIQDQEQPPIRRGELARMLLVAPSQEALRAQGLNFEGSDLSKMDLRNINFRFANLNDCDLSNSQLQGCNFEGASLKNARLDNCDLRGCNFSRTILDNASVINGTFHDPSRILPRCSFEGASCRGCDFEDSNFEDANMRVASFKGASLRNCNLRSCNLAGSDLSECDLSGCNLQGTNLRGTNTQRAKFHKISTAIHSTAFVDQYPRQASARN